MNRNIVKPKSVSFEDALRNLASRLTGCPVSELPRTQEGVVQFMAENVPTLDEMAEAVTQEVMARLEVNKLGEAVTQEVMARLEGSIGEALAASESCPAAAEEAQGGADESEGTSTTPAAETPQEPAEEAAEGTEKPKTTRKTKAKNDN